MVNYNNDHELDEDYELGLSWFEVDTGPPILSYSGFHQCLLHPTQDKAEHFIKASFDLWLQTIITEETNKYTQ